MRPPLHTLLKRLGPRPGFSPKNAQELVEWAVPYGTDWERALAECDADSMLYLVREMGRHHLIPHREIVRAGQACAHSTLHFVPNDEARPRIALDVVGCWLSDPTFPLGVLGNRQQDANAAAHALRRSYAAHAASQACAHAVYAVIARRHNAGDTLGRLVGSVIAAHSADVIARGAPASEIANSGRCVVDILRQTLGPSIIQGLSNYSKVEA